MRYTVRLLGCVCACAALLVTAPTRADAARRDVGTLWAAPTHLQTLDVRYGNFVGYVDAYRTGAGAGSATICMYLERVTKLPDATTRFDFIAGCQLNAKNSAYAFDPLRWKGTLSVTVPVERNFYIENSNGTGTRGPQTSRQTALVKLRWASVGDARLKSSMKTTYATGRPVILGVRARKPAEVNGTITIGRDVVAVNRVKGSMEVGGEAP